MNKLLSYLTKKDHEKLTANDITKAATNLPKPNSVVRLKNQSAKYLIKLELIISSNSRLW